MPTFRKVSVEEIKENTKNDKANLSVNYNSDRLLPMPTNLVSIQQALQGIILPKSLESDGRRYAGRVEDFIVDYLIQHGFLSETEKIRSWCDIMIDGNPINIKATQMKSSDNVSGTALSQLAWALTDIDEEAIKFGGWSVSIELARRLTSFGVINPQRDYFYLVINTLDTNQIILNSLRGLEHLTINANNFPFQVPWKKNLKPILHTNEQLTEKYINLFYETRARNKRNEFESFFKSRYTRSDIYTG